MKSTPVKVGTGDGVLCYDDESGRGEDSLEDWIEHQMPEQPPPSWEGTAPWSSKYVDDLTMGQHHYLPAATTTISTSKSRTNARRDSH